MVGHIAMLWLRSISTISSKIITSDILKDELGFENIIVTDALEWEE